MPRNMSFAMTILQVKNQTKTVTRRIGWRFLEPGDQLQPVEKSMGMVSGQRAVKIGGLIRVVSVAFERLDLITDDDVAREGFPDMGRDEFLQMFCEQHNCFESQLITRIQFEYL